MDKSFKKIIKKYSIILIVFLIIAVVAAVVLDSVYKKYSYNDSFTAVGSVIDVKFTCKHSEDAEQICEETKDKIKEVLTDFEYNQISWRADSSDIAKINGTPGEFVEVSAKTVENMKKIIEFSDSSGGSFDVTIGSLSQLWNVTSVRPSVPSEENINSLVSKVGYSLIEIDGNSVKIPDGQQLDLGAVGKGIACDLIKQEIMKSSIETAVVTVGGSVLLYGGEKDLWNIAIRDPRGYQSDRLGNLRLGACFISTSGDYEKYFEQDGVRYHHIIDPKTGYPSDSGLISVTVIGDNGFLCDALSTACFVLGYKKSLPLLEKYNAEAVFADKDMNVRVTSGLKEKFKLTDEDYTLVE